MVLQPIRWFVWFFSRVIMSWRYSVRVVGRDDVLRTPGPYLLLPNHPAFADPPNLMVHLWPAFQFRPMLLETNFRNPLLAPFGWLLRAIKVPDVTTANAEDRRKAEGAVAAAISALRVGDNVILWPSGRLQRDGIERVGGTRAVADILAAAPEVTVVLVRTRGLWGSMFSWAMTAQPMNLTSLLVRGLLLIGANLVLFLPRRQMTVTLEAFPAHRRPEPTREAINRWLEEWYNADGSPETPTFVPYHFLFGAREYDFPPPPAAVSVDASQVKPETKHGVAEILEEKLNRPLSDDESQPDTALATLGLDSLDTMEVMIRVEQRFGFRGAAIPTTVGQLWALAEGVVEVPPPKSPPRAWFSAPTGSLAIAVEGTTIPEAVVDRVLKTPHDVASMDDVGGLLRYDDILMRGLMLASRFRAVPEPAVGLLMPASSAGVVSLVGLHFAGKLPVILNWTTGPGNMAHGVKLTGVKTVVTSRQFVNRVQVEVPGTQFLYLEDIGKTVGWFEKTRRWIGMKWFRAATARRALAALNPDPHRPAVVLFTSGSEKAPKAVPLTHANVLADLRGAAPLLDIDRTHRVLVFLPLFHSFGHTVTGLFTLMVGVKVVYHPDPTDAAALVRKSAAYQVTAVAATPTFFGYMLDRAKPGDLDQLRVVVLGAEKPPQRVFDRTAVLAPAASILEGYGVTECSPVVSVNPRACIKPGTIGRPVVGTEVCVTDLDTGEVLPPGRGLMGMLHVSGPIVFPGYLGYDGAQPFQEFAGKTWYVTGDLAEIDSDGYVWFRGRLKRFIKAGGEMISLPALEEPFAQMYPPTEDGLRAAVEAIEGEQGRRIVLFTTESITLRDANTLLHEQGFRGIMRLDEVRKLDTIPVLGSGKPDYKQLRLMIDPPSAPHV